jgi:peptidoglycan/xylan/chitin deacetylase (PgdA/CDA1 family)
VGDLDRPFTRGELKEFARQPQVVLGNHTMHHAILTNYPADAVRDELGQAQDFLRETTGARPVAIGYPNGNYSAAVIAVARAVGLQLGITCEPRKNYLPLPTTGDAIMTLGRFMVNGTDRLARECADSRMDYHLYPRCKRWLRHGQGK